MYRIDHSFDKKMAYVKICLISYCVLLILYNISTLFYTLKKILAILLYFCEEKNNNIIKIIEEKGVQEK